MNDDKKIPTDENQNSLKRSRNFYIRLAIIYAVALLLIILAINFDSFEEAINEIVAVISPIFFGAIIAYLCNPIFVFFKNKVFGRTKSVHWRKTLSIILTYLVVFVVIFGLVVLVAEQMIASIESFIMNLDTYVSNAEGFIFGIIDNLDFIKSEAELEENKTPPPLNDSTNLDGSAQTPGTDEIPPESTQAPDDVTQTEDELPSDEEDTEEEVNLFNFSFTKEGLIEAIHKFFSNSGEIFNQIGNALVSSGGAAISFVFNMFLGFIFSVYMLAEKDHIIAHAKKLSYAYLKKEKADALCELANYADDKVGHFIKGKLIESGIVGIMAYFAFLIFGIPSPLMIAVIVAIMNIIPVFGPFLGAIPAAFIVLIMDPIKTIPYILIVVIIMQINGNYVSPLIVGNRTGLTPLGAIAALTLMSGYFGVIGMFLGIPICAIVVEYFWMQANKRLREKQLATEISAYYPADALIESEDEQKHRNFTSVIVDTTVSIFCRVFKVNKKNNKDKKKNNNIDGTSDK